MKHAGDDDDDDDEKRNIQSCQRRARTLLPPAPALAPARFIYCGVVLQSFVTVALLQHHHPAYLQLRLFPSWVPLVSGAPEVFAGVG